MQMGSWFWKTSTSFELDFDFLNDHQDSELITADYKLKVTVRATKQWLRKANITLKINISHCHIITHIICYDFYFVHRNTT